MNNKAVLTAAVAAVAGSVSTSADAATYTATLTQVLVYNNSALNGSAQNISSSTATWSYDDVTNLVTQTGGTYNARGTTNPASTLFRILTTGLIVGNGGPASAATFSCVEGNFGGNVGASICGNYTFGANFLNDSATTWGPGTAVSRTIGGDDTVAGPQESVATYNGMNTVSFNGTTLVIANKTCASICTTFPGAFNGGQQWTFATTPVIVPGPAAAWLFGSAVGVLGWLRRRHTT